MELALLGTTTKVGSHANRNAGFIRQAGEWHWGCRMNPALRWWCQVAPYAPCLYAPSLNLSVGLKAGAGRVQFREDLRRRGSDPAALIVQ